MKCKFIWLMAAVTVSLTVQAQKKPLDQSVYAGWKTIKFTDITDDGAWVRYTIEEMRGDGVLEFYEVSSGRKLSFDRGAEAAFFNNGTWAAFRIKVPFDTGLQAKRDKLKPDEMPKDSFALLNLETRETQIFPNVKSLKTSENGPLALYQYEVKIPADTVINTKEVKFNRLVIYNVVKSDSLLVDSVKNFAVNEAGNLVLYSKEADSLKSVYAYYTGGKTPVPVLMWADSLGSIATNFVLDKTGEQGAFMATSDTVKHALYDLYYFNTRELKPVRVKNEEIHKLPQDYAVSRFGTMAFSTDGNFLQFNIAPKPKEIPNDSLLAEERFSLDLWSWHDTILQTQQNVNKTKIIETVYTAVYYPKEKRAVALGDYYLESIRLPEDDKAPYALGVTSKPYSIFIENNIRLYTGTDSYLVDLKTGERTKILTNTFGSVYLSPGAKYVAYYNLADSCWYSVDTKTLVHTPVTKDIPYPFWNEDDDHPGASPLYGFSGWTTDEKMILPDRYDLWLVDPAGKRPSENLTRTGRDTDTQFKYVNMTREKDKNAIDLSQSVTLLSFNRVNKENGYYRLQYGKPVEKLVEGPYKYAITNYAKNTDRIVYTRENFQEFPDLWTADELFHDQVKFTRANPQQQDYKWGSVESIEWIDLNGNPCEGLLYLPEDYDPTKTYPTIVYFYEVYTWIKYSHYIPAPSRSIINFTYCTSNDYIVFVPDIKYREGFPGKSCYDIVMAGTMALIERGISDPKRIGLQGQSWGGYQSAYLVTQTDLFACSAPGTAVSNMISAYGGIRWGTGLSRAYQYEVGQSRIGAAPWQRRDLYIENSPIFFADRVTTPQLMRHDDNDGAVPWYQSIEFYIALRRLGKPVWLLNYNGDDHNLVHWPARMDWDKRMYQFFDHYLKGAPMPRWMEEGISITEKGIDQKYELIEEVTDPESKIGL